MFSRLLKSKREPSQQTGHMMIDDMRMPYVLVRSPKRRRIISFSINAEEQIRILAPLGARFDAIESTLQRRRSWLKNALEYQRKKQAAKRKNFSSGGEILYLGRPHLLKITIDAAKKQGCELQDNTLTINFHEAATDDDIKLEMMLWYKKQARDYFKTRADFWCQEMGVRYRKLLVSNPRRLWGSCSGRNIVRLNWRLILAPAEIVDYVVVHELAHIKHKNHARQFWSYVERYIPDWRARRLHLRKLGPDVSL